MGLPTPLARGGKYGESALLSARLSYAYFKNNFKFGVPASLS